jgi:hypothetical protein
MRCKCIRYPVDFLSIFSLSKACLFYNNLFKAFHHSSQINPAAVRSTSNLQPINVEFGTLTSVYPGPRNIAHMLIEVSGILYSSITLNPKC